MKKWGWQISDSQSTSRHRFVRQTCAYLQATHTDHRAVCRYCCSARLADSSESTLATQPVDCLHAKSVNDCIAHYLESHSQTRPMMIRRIALLGSEYPAARDTTDCCHCPRARTRDISSQGLCCCLAGRGMMAKLVTFLQGSQVIGSCPMLVDWHPWWSVRGPRDALCAFRFRKG